jgi:hypothetical protein
MIFSGSASLSVVLRSIRGIGATWFPQNLRGAPDSCESRDAPNSPPPELLTDHTTHRLRAWELHFRAMTWHEVAKAPNLLQTERFVAALEPRLRMSQGA